MEQLEIERILKSLNETTRILVDGVEQLSRSEIDDLDYMIQDATRTKLYENFQDAIAAIDEYSSPQGAFLGEHLLSNVAYGPHVRVRGGQLVQIWDYSYAGMYSDIREGQRAAWQLSKKSSQQAFDPVWRSFYWRYIYLGIPPPGWKNFDDGLYDEIMGVRMNVWGDKAPYWLFVEFGTAMAGGYGGTPYPNFPGQYPIAKTRAWFDLETPRVIQDYLDRFSEAVDETIAYSYDYTIEHAAPIKMDFAEEIEVKAWTDWYPYKGKLRRHAFVRGKGGFTGEFEYKEA